VHQIEHITDLVIILGMVLGYCVAVTVPIFIQHAYVLMYRSGSNAVVVVHLLAIVHAITSVGIYGTNVPLKILS
jgi:hypothetical protein